MQCTSVTSRLTADVIPSSLEVSENICTETTGGFFNFSLKKILEFVSATRNKVWANISQQRATFVCLCVSPLQTVCVRPWSHWLGLYKGISPKTSIPPPAR